MSKNEIELPSLGHISVHLHDFPAKGPSWLPSGTLPGVGVRAGKAVKKGAGAGLQLLVWEQPIALFWTKTHLGKRYKAKCQTQRVQASFCSLGSNGSRKAEQTEHREVAEVLLPRAGPSYRAPSEAL